MSTIKADGFFIQMKGSNTWLPWDASLDLRIIAGTGLGTVTHNGTTRDMVSTNPAATDPRLAITNPTPVPNGWTTLTLDGAHDNIQAAINKSGPNATLILAGPARQTFTLKADMALQYPDEPVTLG